MLDCSTPSFINSTSSEHVIQRYNPFARKLLIFFVWYILKGIFRSASGCDKLLIVLSTETGKVINKIPIGAGCDGVAFDEKDKLIFTSNGEGTMTVIQELSANEFKIVETVTTKPNARTITIDEKTHTLFLPAADTAPADPQSQNARRRLVPGTFQVLVVSKNR